MASMLLPETFGLFFAGTFVAAIIYGSTSVQCANVLKTMNRGSILWRLYIVLIWILDLTHLNQILKTAFEYLVAHPISPESKMITSIPSHLLLQKVIFSLTQGVSIWRIWTLVTSRRQRLVPVLLAILVLANLGVGLDASVKVFKLSLVTELREAPLRRTIASSLGATAALDTLITALLAFYSTPAGKKSSLIIGIKTICTMRGILSGFLGYLVVTGSPIATLTFMFLSAEVVLTKLYIWNSISIVFRLAQPSSPPKVFIGGGVQSVHYVKDNKLVEIPLSQELVAELRKVMADVQGREPGAELREESEDDVKEALLGANTESSDKVASLV